MLLSDRDLRALLADGRLRVVPRIGPGAEAERPIDYQIQSNSIDLNLGDSIARPNISRQSTQSVMPIRLREGNARVMAVTNNLPLGAEVPVQPLEFLLATTDEWVSVDGAHAAYVEGKSSHARMGLQVHAAGLVDGGFGGRLTLEIINLAPYAIVLEVGQPIAQLVVVPLSSPCERPYGSPALGSRYQGQIAATAAKGSLRAYLGLTGLSASEMGALSERSA